MSVHHFIRRSSGTSRAFCIETLCDKFRGEAIDELLAVGGLGDECKEYLLLSDVYFTDEGKHQLGLLEDRVSAEVRHWVLEHKDYELQAMRREWS